MADHYGDICKNIRVTDDVSFKLLGLVPLLSGSGILVVVLKSEALLSPAVYLISLFGALLTLGLFRWELRNIQTCQWLIQRAADIERSEDEKKPGQFYRRSLAPALLTLRFGKTEAEKLVYGVTTGAWLAGSVDGVVGSNSQVSDAPTMSERTCVVGLFYLGCINCCPYSDFRFTTGEHRTRTGSSSRTRSSYRVKDES